MLRVRDGEGPAGGMAASLDPTGFMVKGPARQRQRHRRPRGQQGFTRTPKQAAKVCMHLSAAYTQLHKRCIKTVGHSTSASYAM